MSEAETEKPDELTLAISTAKSFVQKAFAGENIENVGLEEVKPPEYGSVWEITLGFDRRRPRPPTFHEAMGVPNAFLQAAAAAAARPLRVYKVVKVDTAIPKALSLTNREED